MTETKPSCYIIAGPNGAGKTTFALRYLPDAEACRNFVNADMIAAGLSPLMPEREKVAASRLFLKEVRSFIAKRESFSFETTLSGRTYLRLIHKLQADGWKVILFYLWLPSVEFSIARVAERVRHGGHHIPKADIQRRFPRSISNLIHEYAPICDAVICLDNTTIPSLIFSQDNDGMAVANQARYQQIIQEADHARTNP